MPKLDLPTTSRRSNSYSNASSTSGTLTATDTAPFMDQTPHALGQVQIKLIYNLQMGCLEVQVVECRGLPHFGKHYPNTFVQISLLPEDGYSEHSKVRTSLRKRSFNPVYNEILRFHNLTKFELDERYLQIGVWHSEAFHSKSLIGECFLKMADYPWNYLDPIWISLKAYPESVPPDPLHVETSRGTITFELRFEMKRTMLKTGDIHFLLKSGHSLCGHPPILAKMPFAKVQLVSGRKVLISARSCLAEFPENGFRPVWDYDIVIQEQNLKKLRKRCLEVSLWDRESASNRRYIGRIRFRISESRNVEDEPQVLWKRMLQYPNECIHAELALRG
uniref:C2 domain-containing protein n=1 Tax=Acrobeloides nanus TaxID=290746 RepID=A0A914CKE0_9BILA